VLGFYEYFHMSLSFDYIYTVYSMIFMVLNFSLIFTTRLGWSGREDVFRDSYQLLGVSIV